MAVLESPPRTRRPSLYAAIKLARLVQRFRETLTARVKSRTPPAKNKCQALTGIAKENLSRVANLKACRGKPVCHVDVFQHREHTMDQDAAFSTLLSQLDCHSKPGGFGLSTIAANDDLLLRHNVHYVVNYAAASRARHVLDLTTLLLDRLQHAKAENARATADDPTVDSIKCNVFIANLEHLLLSLQQTAADALLRHAIGLVEAEVLYWQQYWQQQPRHINDDWFSEWPSGRRPLSTTWPWNIKPSLMVLWGVCWMFIVPRLANKARADPGNQQGDRQWHPQQLGLQGATRLNPTFYGPRNHMGWRSSQPGHVGQTAAPSQNAWAPIIGQTPTPDAACLTQEETGILDSRRGLVAAPYMSSFAAPSGPYVPSTTSWPYIPGPDDTSRQVSHNEWPPNQAPDSLSTQPAVQPYPATTISPYAPDYQSFNEAPSHWSIYPPLNANLAISMEERLPTYPSPRSDGSGREPSICSVIPSNLSPAMLSAISPSTDVSHVSRNHSINDNNDGSPPRNNHGQISCNHQDCAPTPPAFSRKCEWTKHMDKHTRPYICTEPGCEKIQGFTYSGGLLRHQREVHKQHGGPKAPRMCPHPDCKRSSGTGFSRKENLNEHLRRVHRGVGIDFLSASDEPSAPRGGLGAVGFEHQPQQPQQQRAHFGIVKLQPAPQSQVPGQRKRRREALEDDNRGLKEEGSEEGELVAQVKWLKREMEAKDEWILKLQGIIHRLTDGQMNGGGGNYGGGPKMRTA